MIPPGALIIDKQANEKTPFHHAVVLNKVDIAECLIKHGADINRAFDPTESSLTPLQYACKHELVDMVKMILGNGAIDVDNTARKNSVMDNNDNVVQLLLNHGE